MKRLIRKADHDYGNRDSAIAIINGIIYDSSTHARCINKYLSENDQIEFDSTIRRPKKEDLNIEQIAFAHLVSYDEAIYLEEKSLVNISLEEAANIIKTNYPQYSVYNDDEEDFQSWFDENGIPRDITYQLLVAKNK